MQCGQIFMPNHVSVNNDPLKVRLEPEIPQSVLCESVGHSAQHQMKKRSKDKNKQQEQQHSLFLNCLDQQWEMTNGQTSQGQPRCWLYELQSFSVCFLHIVASQTQCQCNLIDSVAWCHSQHNSKRIHDNNKFKQTRQQWNQNK